MPASRFESRRPQPVRHVLAVALVLVACACSAARTSTSAATTRLPTTEEAVWRGLATARVAPLAGAVRVSVGQILFIDENPRGLDAPPGAAIGLSELVAVGLLRRPDVRFVEQRRFAAAADAERRGESRPPRAPRAGVSPGAEFILSATWASFGAATAYLEGRLTNPASGRIERTWRTETPREADAVGVARAIVGGLMAELARMGRVPAWSDPLAHAAPTTFEPSNISASALNAFLAGLASEEAWNWEGARVGYQEAGALDSAFFEADVALARTARLRMGGTLGSS